MNVPPDRIGHGTFLHLGPEATDATTVQKILKNRIPIGTPRDALPTVVVVGLK